MQAAFRHHHPFIQPCASCRAHKGVRGHHHGPGGAHQLQGGRKSARANQGGLPGACTSQLGLRGWLKSAEMQRTGRNGRVFQEEQTV